MFENPDQAVRCALLKGVKFGKHFVETETVIYRSVTGTVRKIQGEHRDMAKFRLD